MSAKTKCPAYALADLLQACSIPGKVVVRKSAKEDAKKFGFDSQARILEFLAIGEFEEIELENSGTLDHGPDVGVNFDAYIFKLGTKHVYLAFYKRHTGVWVIKSFHVPSMGEKASSLSQKPFIVLERLKK